jgi:hypothetical protein
MTRTASHVIRPTTSPTGLRKLWRGFRRIWSKPHETTIGQIVTAAAVLALAGWLILAGFQGVKDREITKATGDRLESEYRTALANHDRDVSSFNLCLTAAEARVDTRDTIRKVLFDYADGIANLLPGEPLAQQFAKDRHVYVDANYGPYDLPTERSKCQAPGPDPIDPTPGD